MRTQRRMRAAYSRGSEGGGLQGRADHCCKQECGQCSLKTTIFNKIGGGGTPDHGGGAGERAGGATTRAKRASLRGFWCVDGQASSARGWSATSGAFRNAD